MSAPSGVRRPKVDSLGIMLPASWWVIDLRDDDARRRSVARLVAQEVGPQDELATVRAQLRSRLDGASHDAAAAGGRLMAVSLMRAAGIPLTATVTVYRVPGAGVPGDELEHLHGALEEAPVPGQELELAMGIEGPVLRRVYVRTATDDVDAPAIPMLLVDYWLDPQDGHGLVLMSFSSPLVTAREGLLDLFDLIVASVGPDEGES